MQTNQHHQQDALVERAVFPRLPEAVELARHWVRKAYDRVGGKQVDTCELLVSELFTNAVRYAVGDRVEVTVWASLEVDVWDGSPKEPVTQAPDDESVTGRGLLLVAALTSLFVVIPSEGGKTVKFRIDGE